MQVTKVTPHQTCFSDRQIKFTVQCNPFLQSTKNIKNNEQAFGTTIGRKRYISRFYFHSNPFTAKTLELLGSNELHLITIRFCMKQTGVCSLGQKRYISRFYGHGKPYTVKMFEQFGRNELPLIANGFFIKQTGEC